MHFKHFSKDLVSIHVWRQVETQTTIINFYEEDFNILNPRQNFREDGGGLFRMEFPLMQWIVAALYKLFGDNLIITRLFMFLTGLITITGIYELLINIFQRKPPAIAAACTFAFSPGFYYYTINPMPDNFALCCSVWGLAFFFRWIRERNMYCFLFSGLLIGIGALSKLPFILYFTLPLAYLFRKKEFRQAALYPVPVVLPAAWYMWVIPGWADNPVVKGILENSSSFLTKLDYLQHNLVSTMPEVLLGYGSLVFFIAGIYFFMRNRKYRREIATALIIWAIALSAFFIYEIEEIGKIHDYYLFPFYPMLFILVGYGAGQLISSGQTWIKYLSYLLIITAPLFSHLRMQGRWDIESPGFNPDLLIHKEALRNAVPDDALCVVGKDVSARIYFYYTNKKGWYFNSDHLMPEKLEDMIERGAEFMYSDSRMVDQDPAIIPYLEGTVSEHGSIKIFRLAIPQDEDI